MATVQGKVDFVYQEPGKRPLYWSYVEFKGELLLLESSWKFVGQALYDNGHPNSKGWTGTTWKFDEEKNVLTLHFGETDWVFNDAWKNPSIELTSAPEQGIVAIDFKKSTQSPVNPYTFLQSSSTLLIKK